eukprot:Skav219585  [mRNA]  locus=scaffold249:260004:260279:- [translate_table: standard]
MRKPAASPKEITSKAVHKKPAAAVMKSHVEKSESKAAKPKAKATRFVDILDDKGKVLISGKYRKKYYPEGCKKCREAPGCTPSCYRYRKEC